MASGPSQIQLQHSVTTTAATNAMPFIAFNNPVKVEDCLNSFGRYVSRRPHKPDHVLMLSIVSVIGFCPLPFLRYLSFNQFQAVVFPPQYMSSKLVFLI